MGSEFAIPDDPDRVFFYSSQGRESRPILRGKDAKTTFDSIPVIDVSSIMSDNLEERKRLAAAVDRAASEVGFFYFDNPPVDTRKMDTAFAAIKKLFALPSKEKMKVHVNNSPNGKGYAFRAQEEGHITNESFGMGNDYTEPEQAATSGGMTSTFPLNRWPDEALPEFRAAIYEYWKEVHAFSRRLVGIFALALGLDEHALDHMFQEPLTDVTIQHYCKHPSDSYKPALTPHSDYGAFTCLLQTEVGGLEVLNANAIWVPVPLREHAFVMNTGSHFEILSNGRWKATVHRVSGRGDIDRYSLPFFWGFDPTTVVTPLEKFRGETNLEPELAGREFAKGTFSTKPDHPVVAEMKARGLEFEDYCYANLLHGKDPWVKG
ncbi:Clavaminate synthase-like protein [Aspergillus violaceofuscus CBS 115571]|uniref:Clavaminate synthase-like protein n=1 Tax=Aspergillus violaceofuscus (strain CBS 115571) TaxID=1450538 RepID=A0A2V5I294_ASPV1|nr:Clavaminate synthase-like protein [Aspergillus violaceofuscus CBS 115571]